jgi:hypothetical protein
MQTTRLLVSVAALLLIGGCGQSEPPATAGVDGGRAASLAQEAFLETTNNQIRTYQIWSVVHTPTQWNFKAKGTDQFARPGFEWDIAVDRISGQVRVQLNSPDVEVRNLRSAYARGDVIHFQVLSRSGDPLEFYCTVERLDEQGDWDEIPYRMEDGRVTKSNDAYRLDPGTVKELAWDPALIVSTDYPPGRPPISSGKYRISVHLLGDRKDALAVSGSFLLDWESVPAKP